VKSTSFAAARRTLSLGHDEMTPYAKRQTIDFLLASACLLVGSVLYILFRPTTLLLFHWANWLGLMELIATARSHVHPPNGHLAGWAIYSLPFALWVLSHIFIVNGVWGKSPSPCRVAYLWSVPIVAITAELAQGLRILPGQFDPVDLVTIIIATILGIATRDCNHFRKVVISL
jgi:hypothetical protein